jgi:hypothetical protein
MKFICYAQDNDSLSEPTEGNLRSALRLNPRCREHLQKWAGDSTLVTPTFYFWGTGFQQQMSQKGLFLMLLHHILRQCPILIPRVSPSRWETLCLFNYNPRDWSEPELRRMFKLVIANLNIINAKLCLFIDGLDEFAGDHNELLSLFSEITANKRVKLCVASRPWVVFEEGFNRKPHLMLQDLTYPDIWHYVSSNFHENTTFARLQQLEPIFAGQLVENIASKASGVFLWVQLVVRSILAGITAGDRVEDLQRRLDLLPEDLENLYDKILESADEFYRDHAAQLFELMKESPEPPSALQLSFVDEGLKTIKARPVAPIFNDEMAARVETMRRRINSRCKGLLEVERKNAMPRELKVLYMHATVKEYLQREDVQEKLQLWMKEAFDPHLKLCAGNLAMLKVTDAASTLAMLKNTDPKAALAARDQLMELIDSCLEHASKVQPDSSPEVIFLLDDPDRTGLSQTRNLATHGTDSEITTLAEAGHWVFSAKPLSLPLQFSEKEDFGQSFLSLMADRGLLDYVRARVKPECAIKKPALRDLPSQEKTWPLLLDLIFCRSESLDKVRCLLEHGASPNQKSRIRNFEASPWILLLILIFHRQSPRYLASSPIERPNARHSIAYLSEVARLMLRHGAEVSDCMARTLFSKLLPAGSTASLYTRQLLLRALYELQHGQRLNLKPVLSSLEVDGYSTTWMKDLRIFMVPFLWAPIGWQ